jgi:hypothetical protein
VTAALGAVRWRGRIRAEEWLVLAVIGWGLVSATVNRGSPLAAKETLVDWLVAGLVFVIVRRADDSKRGVVLALAAVAAVVVALAVVVECLLEARLRMGGLYVNPNVAASLLVPMTAAVWLVRWDRRWMPALATAILAAGVVATGSRAALLALVVVVAAMVPAGRVRVVVVLAAAAAAVGLIVWRFVMAPDSLAWHRFAIWGAIRDLIGANPVLGVGPGRLEDAAGVVRIAHAEPIARFRHVIGSAESTALGLAVRVGLVGLAVAIAAAVGWFRRTLADGRLREPAVRGVVLAIVVLAAFHDLLDQGVVLWWWAVLAAVAAPVAGDSDRPPVAPRVLIAAALAGLVLAGTAQPGLARLLWSSAPASPASAERALRAEPWYPEPVVWRVRDLLRRPGWDPVVAAETLAWSDRAVRIHSASAETWSLRALVQTRIVQELGAWPGSITGARRDFREAAQREPHLAWYWLQWAQHERTVGRLDEAERLATRAVEEEPNFVRGWFFLARVRIDRGRIDSAREARDRGLEARRKIGGRKMSEYERDLTRMPAWQAEELSHELD